MPSTNSRKRAAPGASPAGPAQMQQNFGSPSQLSNDQFLRWNQNGDSIPFPDAASYNMNAYGANSISNPQFQPPVAQASNQLARRPISRQLVSTVPRPGFDGLGDPWGGYGDDALLDPQNPMMEENDNIELLEERAVIAKRDAQSKRKQIPPFVQKLSR
jgi:heat shock transcription factor